MNQTKVAWEEEKENKIAEVEQVPVKSLFLFSSSNHKHFHIHLKMAGRYSWVHKASVLFGVLEKPARGPWQEEGHLRFGGERAVKG